MSGYSTTILTYKMFAILWALLIVTFFSDFALDANRSMRSERKFEFQKPVLNEAQPSNHYIGIPLSRRYVGRRTLMSVGVAKDSTSQDASAVVPLSLSISCSRERALPADPVINRLPFLSKQRRLPSIDYLFLHRLLGSLHNEIYLHNISILVQREIWPWTTFTKSSVVSTASRASPLISMNFRTRKVSFPHPDPGEFIFNKTTT